MSMFVHNHYEKLDHVKPNVCVYYKYKEKTKVWEVPHKWTLSNLFSDLLAHDVPHKN
jgi:hypothetical protein